MDITLVKLHYSPLFSTILCIHLMKFPSVVSYVNLQNCQYQNPLNGKKELLQMEMIKTGSDPGLEI